MLEHLVEADAADYVPEVIVDLDGDDSVSLTKATPAQHLEARIQTAEFLRTLHVVDENEALLAAERRAAEAAFAALTGPVKLTDEDKHKLLLQLDAPASVRHIVGMLTAYDWQFVEKANEIRSFCVAKLLEEAKHPEAKIRLRAIELLGKVTEVALFTERVHVTKRDLTDEDLDRRLKEKLRKLDMSDAQVIDEDETLPPNTTPAAPAPRADDPASTDTLDPQPSPETPAA